MRHALGSLRLLSFLSFLSLLSLADELSCAVPTTYRHWLHTITPAGQERAVRKTGQQISVRCGSAESNPSG